MRTEALQRLLYYMRERETIRIAKAAGTDWPWTTDPILRTYKFTNIHRSDDHTSKALFGLYDLRRKNSPLDIVLYNCAIYRYFGTISFAMSVGWRTTHDAEFIAETARGLARSGTQVFTGAYIVTNAGITGPKEEVVAGFLGDLWADRLSIIEALERTQSWREMYLRMLNIKGFGGKGFMAKEVLQDFLYNFPYAAKDAVTWTPVGPGARRGINRIIKKPINEDTVTEKFLEPLLQIREWLLPKWAEAFPGDKLTAHDVQFVLCEYDKYERTRLGEGHPRSFYRWPGGSR